MLSSLGMEMPTTMELLAEFEKLSPIRQFQMIWCALMAFAFAFDFPSHMRFYRWFNSSGLEMANRSGYGQSAGKFYGVIPAPKLSLSATVASGLCLITSLAIACTGVIDPRICLMTALISYHCYIPQLYAEVHVVAHNMALVPPALILCLVSSDVIEPAAEGVDGMAQQFPLFLIKFVITSAYCSAALCKITKCFTDGADWTSGATMQAVMFEAILSLNLPCGEAGHWTFSKPTPFSRALQRWLFKQPTILGLMSVYGVVIELLAPLTLIFPILDIPFALLGLGLHYGIAYCQNIDFLPWWGPAYAVFLVSSTSRASYTGMYTMEMVTGYAQAYPVAFGLGLAYLAVHLAGMVIHRLIPDIDMLPLSRFPMFDSPKNLWDPSKPHWAWLTDKQQAPGELMNFAFPMCRPQHVMPSEMDRLPFRHLLFGKAKPDDVAMTVYTNVEITPQLQAILDSFWEEWQKGADKSTDPETLNGMLDLVDAAKKAFETAPRRQFGKASPESGFWDWLSSLGRGAWNTSVVVSKSKPLLQEPLLQGADAADLERLMGA
mmetsp:Transcript_18945/g.34315  ORF Transcript_18945/g.34315 Transcript_18945/m.34315 type:complete len:548 (+) Transcript_18945:89-1732(+)